MLVFSGARTAARSVSTTRSAELLATFGGLFAQARPFYTEAFPPVAFDSHSKTQRKNEFAVIKASNNGADFAQNRLDIEAAIKKHVVPGFYAFTMAEPTITDASGDVEHLSPVTHIMGLVIKVNEDGKVEILPDTVVNMTYKGKPTKKDAVDPETGLSLRRQEFAADADLRDIPRSLSFMFGDSHGRDGEKLYACVRIKDEDSLKEIMARVEAVKKKIVEEQLRYDRQRYNCGHPVLEVFAPRSFALLPTIIRYGLTPQKALATVVEEMASSEVTARVLTALACAGVNKTAMERGAALAARPAVDNSNDNNPENNGSAPQNGRR